MSLFNQLVYHVLIFEIIVYIITLLPFYYIPIHMQKIVLIKLKKLVSSQAFIWAYRFIAVFMVVVLADSATRSYKLAKEPQYSSYDPILNAASQVDLSLKVKRFYVQRNFYMSLFAVFMLVVLNNRFDLIFSNLELKSSVRELTDKYNIVKKHNEKLVIEYANNPRNIEEMNKKYSTCEGSPVDETEGEKAKDTSPGTARQRKKNSTTSKPAEDSS